MKELVNDEEAIGFAATYTPAGGTDAHTWEVVVVVAPPETRADTAARRKAAREAGGAVAPKNLRFSLVNGTETYRGPHFDAVITAIHDYVAKKGKTHPPWKAAQWAPQRRHVSDVCALYLNVLAVDVVWNEQVKTHMVSPREKDIHVKLPASALKAIWEKISVALANQVAATDTKVDRENALNLLADPEKYTPAGALLQRLTKKKLDEMLLTLWILEGNSARRLVDRLLKIQKKDARYTPKTNGVYNLGGVINNVSKHVVEGEDGQVIVGQMLKKNAKARALLELVQKKQYARYVISTDMDIDGGFIGCLVLELIRYTDPSALAEGRVALFVTPQARFSPSKKGVDPIEFYSGSMVAKAVNGEIAIPAKGVWSYYKGLAALPPGKDRLLVVDLHDRIHPLTPKSAAAFKEAQQLYFSKPPAERRAVLSLPPSETARRSVEKSLEHAGGTPKGAITAEHFTHNTMYEYSYASIHRHMIASLDGCTESARKIIYGLMHMGGGPGDEIKITSPRV
jgi:DNA gyrase/topoisomerase IV subunit B